MIAPVLILFLVVVCLICDIRSGIYENMPDEFDYFPEFHNKKYVHRIGTACKYPF